MLRTLNILARGVVAQQEEAVTDRYAVALLDQKLRDCETNFKAAKATLATLIRRQRLEEKQIATVDDHIRDLSMRAEAAMQAGAEDLLTQAAGAIAALENEQAARKKSYDDICGRVERMRLSLERAYRRVMDLRHGAAMARAADQERKAQSSLSSTTRQNSDLEEAESLITRIMGQSDPFEEDEILRGIDDELTGAATSDRLEQAGFGPRTKTTAEDVISRLRSKSDNE